MVTYSVNVPSAPRRATLRNEALLKCLAWLAAKTANEKCKCTTASRASLRLLLTAFLRLTGALARHAQLAAQSSRRSEANVLDMLRAVSTLSLPTSRLVQQLSQGRPSTYFQIPPAPVDVPPLFVADFALTASDSANLFVPSPGKLAEAEASTFVFDRLFVTGTRFLHAVQKDLLMLHLRRQQDPELDEARHLEETHFSFLPGEEDVQSAKSLSDDPLMPLLKKKSISIDLVWSIRRLSLRVLHMMWPELTGHALTGFMSESPVPPGHQTSGEHISSTVAEALRNKSRSLIGYIAFHSPTLPDDYTYSPRLEALVADKDSTQMLDRYSHAAVTSRDRLDAQVQLPQLMNTVPTLEAVSLKPEE